MRNKIQAEAVQAIKDNNWHGLVDVAPRTGKTKIGVDSIKGKGEKKIAVIYPFKPIEKSWKIDIEKWKLGFTPILLNQRSAKKLPDDLDLLICDEGQTLTDSQICIIKSKKPKRILILTGTISERSKKNLKYLLNVEPIYKYSIEQAIEDKIISDYEIFIKYVDLTALERKQYNLFSDKFLYYKELLDDQKKLEESNLSFHTVVSYKEIVARKRMHLLYSVESKINAAKELINGISSRVLVFTSLTKVADRLSKHSFHSKSSKESLDLFLKEEINTLSVVNQVSMGVTFPVLKHAVIHQIQSNEELQVQKILRTCNLEGDKKAQIYITVAKDTQDEVWLASALQGTDSKRIKYI